MSRLTDALATARHAVAFTGAGVSTLSGIPDFRGANGLYTRSIDESVFDLARFDRDPATFYRKALTFLYAEPRPRPSLVHRTLAAWQAEGRLKAVLTQNIDALHQEAGSSPVVEVHGTLATHSCRSCGQVEGYDVIRRRLHGGEVPPRCSCGGVFKPDVTFFGEALPARAWREATRHARDADLILVLGTSLTVHPAAGLPELTLAAGGRLVIVNDQPTPLDAQAALRLTSLEAAFR